MKPVTDLDHRMNSGERRAALSLGSIFSLRMLGLFMILPVFALYAEQLEGATPTLTGLAIGVYGLTQALLQIPYGLLSDRFGRKRLIMVGLVVFAAGSVVAALADTMLGVVLGRALQGAGAIGAVVMALAADLTRDQHRTKIMAAIGMSIGLSFAAALVLGPVLNDVVGVRGIFWLTAVLALAGVGVLYGVVPEPAQSTVHRDAEPVVVQFAGVLRDSQLLRLDFGILVLHMILTAGFVVLPVALRDLAGLDAGRHWQVYLSVLAVSVLVMLPLMIYGERYRKVKPIFLGAVVLVGVSQFGLVELHRSLTGIVVMLVIFFTGFNLLEATLPSLISRMAPADAKGTAMGFYSSSQFFGVFLGGLLGGWLFGKGGIGAVFFFCSGASLVWLLVAAGMQSPRYLSSYLFPSGPLQPEQALELERRLIQIQGVAEVAVVAAEQVAYLKVDLENLDRDALTSLAVTPD
ncbi:MAG: MFS transporter [Gammaproteobacteria bacterium]